MSYFKCYSSIEQMGKCASQCDFCKQHYHALPRITQKYVFKLEAPHTQYHIELKLPKLLLEKLQVLKAKDPKALQTALSDLIATKI